MRTYDWRVEVDKRPYWFASVFLGERRITSIDSGTTDFSGIDLIVNSALEYMRAYEIVDRLTIPEPSA